MSLKNIMNKFPVELESQDTIREGVANLAYREEDEMGVIEITVQAGNGNPIIMRASFAQFQGAYSNIVAEAQRTIRAKREANNPPVPAK